MAPAEQPRALLDELAEWAVSVRLETLPGDVAHHARRCFLDFLGVTLAGSRSRTAGRVQRALAAFDGGGRSTVLGAGGSASAAGAALANGAAAIALELDDGHTRAYVHPGAVCIPGILALAEDAGADGGDVLAAIAVAYEVCCRLGMAGSRGIHERGFHGLALVGVFGAAAGAAKILGASRAEFASALSLAGVNAGGLLEHTGGWLEATRVQAGRAAADGVLCGILAREGVVGPEDLMESPRGYARSFVGGELDRGVVCGGLGSEWAMLGVYVKQYPFCRCLHSPVEAFLEVVRRHDVQADEIRRIVVETSWEGARLGAREWSSADDAQMSIPFALAVTAWYGWPGIEVLTGERHADPRVRALAKRIHVQETDECNRELPDRLAARVTVETGRGAFSEWVRAPMGEPAASLPDAELERKFARLAAPVVGEDRCARIAQSVWSMGGGRPVTELGLGA